MAIAAFAALAAIAIGYWQLSSNSDIRPVGLSQGRIALLAAALKQASSSGRPVYQYSVISGGVYNATELGAAIKRDPVVASHYKNISLANVRAEQVKEPQWAYVSYRKGDEIYWTKNKVRLNPGETILTDGETQVRARCGNCISSQRLGPVSDEEPEAIELDALLPAEGGSQGVAPLIAAFRVPTLGGGSSLASNRPGGGGASPAAGGMPGMPGGIGGGGPFASSGGRLGGASGVPGSLAVRAPGLVPSGGSGDDDAPGGGVPGGDGPPGLIGAGPPGGGAPGGGSPGGDPPGGSDSPGGGPPGGSPPGGSPPGGSPPGGSPPGGGGAPGGGPPGDPLVVELPVLEPPDGDPSPTVTVRSVPEPMTVALIGTGLAGLALRNRRRRR